MKGREFKDAMYDGLAKLLKAISNPNRLEIIEMLSQGEKSVEGIVQTTNLTFANASQHLHPNERVDGPSQRHLQKQRDYCLLPWPILCSGRRSGKSSK